MFGADPQRPVERIPGKVRVHSIFPTIQGEGPYAGCPAVFVRLAGCNLACEWCDTEFESNDELTPVLDVAKAVDDNWAGHFGHRMDMIPLVVVTGGEPMRQSLADLCHTLVLCCTHVQIETSGSLWDDGFFASPMPMGVEFVVSPKLPAINESCARHASYHKYIVRAGEVDAEGWPATTYRADVPRRTLAKPRYQHTRIYLNPCDDLDNDKNKANLAQCVESSRLLTRQGRDVRVGVQMHKLMGLP